MAINIASSSWYLVPPPPCIWGLSFHGLWVCLRRGIHILLISKLRMKLLSLQRGKSNEDIDLCCLKQLSCSTTPEIATRYSIFKTRHSPRFVWQFAAANHMLWYGICMSKHYWPTSSVTCRHIPSVNQMSQFWLQHFMVLTEELKKHGYKLFNFLF